MQYVLSILQILHTLHPPPIEGLIKMFPTKAAKVIEVGKEQGQLKLRMMQTF